MAGTVPLSLQQQFNVSTGRLLSGGRLYFYQAGSSNPQNAYTTSGLSTAHPNPITLGSDARVPFLWFADGTIRIRLTDSGGVAQFDQDNIPVLGDGGGGGVDTTDPNSIADTGDIKFRLQTGTLSGWVRLNGRSIGNASSGATELASALTENLFAYLWNNFSDSICAVLPSGRGSDAATDYAANKRIGLPDLRGRTIFGLDDMGSSSAGVITSATFSSPTTAGSVGGEERHTLITSETPVHNHTATSTVTDPGHSHLAGTGNSAAGGSGGVLVNSANTQPTSTSVTSITVATSIANTGGGGAHNNMPPGSLGTWYMRL